MRAGLQAAVIHISVEGVARVASGALEASLKSPVAPLGDGGSQIVV